LNIPHLLIVATLKIPTTLKERRNMAPDNPANRGKTMKKILLAASTATLIAFAGIPTVLAQENQPTARPIEMWACSFNDGMDQDDMNDVYEEIDEDNGDARYGAWQLNPYLIGNLPNEFDFLYVGSWQNGNVMGEDLTSMHTGAYESNESWGETVTCPGLLFNSWTIHPGAVEEDGHYFVTLSDCTTAHGVSNAQAMNAIRRYSDYLVENGQTESRSLWFPRHGGGDSDFDFKLVTVYSGPQAWGDAWQWEMENRAFQQRRNFMNGLVSCDESRVYSTRTIMDNLAR